MAPEQDDVDELLAAARAASRPPRRKEPAGDDSGDASSEPEVRPRDDGETSDEAGDDVDELLNVARAAAPASQGSRPVKGAAAGSAARSTGSQSGRNSRRRSAPDSRQRTSPGRAAHHPVPEATTTRPRGFLIVVGVIVMIAMLIAAYALGRASVEQGGAAGATPVDAGQIAELQAKIATDPTDEISLRMLGNIYYDANDFVNALDAYEKAAVLAPEDENRWIAVAAAAFQSGNASRAFEAWNTALAINPDNIEGHYGLANYYSSLTPPDTEKARVEWSRVADIDPESPLAEQARSELAQLDSPSNAPDPAAS